MDSAALDLLAALLTGRDPEGPTWSLAENRHLLVLLATSLAALIGCGVALLVRRSASPPAAQTSPRPLATKPQVDPDPDDGRQKVTVFFGTQTGTAEGFAKALVEEAKARYDKAVFKVVDLDDYAAEDEEYEEKLKKETIALFFLATYGDGEPTDNAERFYKWLSRGNERGEWLSNLWFALFGLGNRQYEHFNKVGKVDDQLLAEQGGKCIVPLVLEMMINALRMTSTHGRNCYGLNWINCSVLKMILQQHQLLRQLLFRNIELCLSNQRTPHISTSLSVSPMVMLSMTFNILAEGVFSMDSRKSKKSLGSYVGVPISQASARCLLCSYCSSPAAEILLDIFLTRMVPTRIHVTCALVCGPTPTGRIHKGVCSTWMKDFIYEDELTNFVHTGARSELIVAFSREGPTKGYVQHKMADRLPSFGASFLRVVIFMFVVARRAWLEMCTAHYTPLFRNRVLWLTQKTESYVKSLQMEGRYLRDVW